MVNLFSLTPEQNQFFSGGININITNSTIKSNIITLFSDCFNILNDLINDYDSNSDYLTKLKNSTLTISLANSYSFAGSASIVYENNSFNCQIKISLPYYNYFKDTQNASINGISENYIKVIILHEIIHLLGFGIRINGYENNPWDNLIKNASELDTDLTNNNVAPLNSGNLYFTGTNSINALKNIINANSGNINLGTINLNKIVGVPLEDYGNSSTSSVHIEGFKSTNNYDSSNTNDIYLDHVKYPFFPRSIMMGIPKFVEITNLETGVLKDLGYNINNNSEYILSNDLVTIKPLGSSTNDGSNAIGENIKPIIHSTTKPNDVDIVFENDNININNSNYIIHTIYQNGEFIYVKDSSDETLRQLTNNVHLQVGNSNFLIKLFRNGTDSDYEYLFSKMQFVNGYDKNTLAINII
jgi:hypothetical protein